MGYTIGQISNILLKADRTMYKIGQIAYDDMFAEDSEALDYERDIIFIYKKAVEYGDDLFIGTTKLDALVEKLASKISVYDYGLLTPVYADVLTSVSNLVIGAAGLNDLTDVTISNILDNQILRYNATLGQWVNVAPGSAIRNSQTFIATNGQTVFTTSYPFDSGLFDVYLNGVRLNTSSYTTIGEYQITLLDGALVDDIIDVVIYDADTNILNPINSLSDLDDVLIGGLSNQQGLYFNTTSGKWENGAVFVPYTGAIANVNLGTFDLTADIVTANTLVKAGGTSTQILRADGQVYTFPLAISSPTSGQVLKYNGTSWVNDSDAGITGTGVSGQVSYWSGTNTQTGSNNLFWDATNSRLRINTQFLAGNEQNFNVYGSALFQQTIGDAQKIYIGNNTSLPTGDGRLLITPNQIKLNDRLTALLINADNLNLGASITLNGRDSDAGSLLMGASGNTAIKIFATTRNIAIQNGGTFTDSGQRLQVIGDTLLRGSGNTSATTALTVQNSDGSNLLRVFNNGLLRFGNTGSSFAINPTSGPTYAVDLAGSNVNFTSNTTSQDCSLGRFLFSGGTLIRTTDNVVSVNIASLSTFAPTGGIVGNGRFVELLLQSTINQTGTAVGITRGLHINPTLTSAPDWRSIEWSNNTGWGLYGAGTANNYLAGSLGIGKTTPLASIDISSPTTAGLHRVLKLGSGSTTTDNATYIEFPSTTSDGFGSMIAGGREGAGAISYLRFFTCNGTTNIEGFRLTSAQRLLIGQTTDSGQRLQVTGDTLLKGSGNTSATTALTVQNSDGNNLWRFRNDGTLFVGNISSGAYIFPFSTTYNTPDVTGGRNIQFFSQITSQSAFLGAFYFAGSNYAQTSGAQIFTNITNGFAPTSGTATFALLNVGGTINQTGGANGITRGLLVSPTLTAAADWRSIEWSNNSGWGLYGAGTSNNFLAGSLGIGSTTLTGFNFRMGKNIEGALTSYGAAIVSTVQSGVTNGARVFYTEIGTQAASFTLSELSHYYSVQGSIGAGSSVLSQYGFRVHENLTGATNNYGFYGNIASGTGRWNLYMNGTANNYLNGNLSIATTNTPRRINIQQATGSTAASIGLYSGDGSLSSVIGLASGITSDTQIASIAGIRFYSGSTIGNIVTEPTNERMRLFTNGNLVLGGTTSTDSGERLQVNGTMKVTGAVTLSNYLNGALSTNSTGVVTIEPSFSDLSLGESYAFDIQNYYVANGYTINPMDTGYQYARLLRSGQLRNATMLLIPQATKTSLLALNIPTADMSVVRATTATRVNKLGLVETVAANVARIDYTSNGDALLVEALSTNILQRSDDFANAYWIKSLGTLTSNAITAPDGTLTADLFTKTSAVNTVSRIHATPYTTTGNHTFSIFIKQNVGNDVLFRFDGSGNAANFTFNFATKVLTNLGVISSSFQEFKNGWFRITATANVTNTGWQLDVLNLFPNATNDSVYVWGAQLETGSSMTSYIPTVAASVTRDADVITYSGLTGNSVITETFENGTTNTITNPTTYTISQGRLKSAIRI